MTDLADERELVYEALALEAELLDEMGKHDEAAEVRALAPAVPVTPAPEPVDQEPLVLANEETLSQLLNQRSVDDEQVVGYLRRVLRLAQETGVNEHTPLVIPADLWLRYLDTLGNAERAAVRHYESSGEIRWLNLARDGFRIERREGFPDEEWGIDSYQ